MLYSTGNYIQYSVINGKEYEKECIYVCITESLCYTAVMNTLQINHTLITKSILRLENLVKTFYYLIIFSNFYKLLKFIYFLIEG